MGRSDNRHESEGAILYPAGHLDTVKDPFSALAAVWLPQQDIFPKHSPDGANGSVSDNSDIKYRETAARCSRK